MSEKNRCHVCRRPEVRLHRHSLTQPDLGPDDCWLGNGAGVYLCEECHAAVHREMDSPDFVDLPDRSGLVVESMLERLENVILLQRRTR